MAPGAALDAEGIWFAYAPGRHVLRGVSIRVDHGEVVALLGTSGSGKTTLLKVCRGLLRPERGAVRLEGEPLRARSRGPLDPRIAYIPQQLGLVRALSVLDNVLLGAAARVGALPLVAGAYPPAAVAEARALLDRLGIGEKAGERAYALSGGERQRVAIARALMQRPRVIVADELISQLDPHTSAVIVEVVREAAGAGAAVLMSTHEPRLVRERCDRAVVLRAGEKVVDVRTAATADRELAVALRP